VDLVVGDDERAEAARFGAASDPRGGDEVASAVAAGSPDGRIAAVKTTGCSTSTSRSQRNEVSSSVSEPCV
jgi:hypothetical protein